MIVKTIAVLTPTLKSQNALTHLLSALHFRPDIDLRLFHIPASSRYLGNGVRQIYEKVESSLHQRHLTKEQLQDTTQNLENLFALASKQQILTCDALLNLGQESAATPYQDSHLPQGTLVCDNLPLAEALDQLFNNCLKGRPVAKLELISSKGQPLGGMYRANPTSYSITSREIGQSLANLVLTWLELENKAAVSHAPPMMVTDLPAPQGPIATIAKITHALYKKITKRLQHKPTDHWVLLHANADRDTTIQDPQNFKVLAPPQDRFWADPFLIHHEGRYFIFLEEYRYDTPIGRICAMELTKEGHTAPQVVLEKDYHLSYPFLWKEGEELYMLPETSQNNRIELYRCVKFPDQWTLDCVLVEDICAKDSTLTKHDGLYWLFSLVKTHGEKDDCLHIHHAQHLKGPWQSHQSNPVLVDCTKARPAGNFFHKEDTLFRVSQDCSESYGQAVVISRVDELTTESYKESTVQILTAPDTNRFAGFHTFNADGKHVVADALPTKLTGVRPLESF